MKERDVCRARDRLIRNRRRRHRRPRPLAVHLAACVRAARGSDGPPVSGTVEELTARLAAAAREIVPWFLEQMPESYFEDIDATSRLEHMGAILALRAVGQEPRLRIKSADGRRITYILPEDAPGTLTALMRDFSEGVIRAAKLYSSRDKQLIVDTFDIGGSAPCNLDGPDLREKYLLTLSLAEKRHEERGGDAWPATDLLHYFAGLTEDYVRACSPERILSHADLCRQLRLKTSSVVLLDNTHADRSRLVIACANVSSTSMLLRVANRLSTLSIDITRAYVDTMFAEAEEPVVIISAVVVGSDGQRIDPDSALWRRLSGDLRRIEWLDAETLELGYRESALDLGGADALMTYAELVHGLLVKSNRYLYSRSQIKEILQRHLALSTKLVGLFLSRFDPKQPMADAEYEIAARGLARELEESVDDDLAGTVLATVLEAIGATLKTNYFVPGRYALALRLSPALIMRGAPRDDVPHGVFWVHGQGFNAFHVRFRDTARGGVRVVRPVSTEQHLRESERHLDEAYELAYAQELKNKDIPEGGAKAVLLVHPARDITPCVRAFTDAILDLITADPVTRTEIVDRLGCPESIYFGPDENITPSHITWIVARAKERKYPVPTALMSSKAGAGINHKQFGVTSEGLNVFLEVALKTIGIDPRRQSFTLKLTGGPDGDVAGNEIKIAIREFGERVKIVGIADGLGCAEDPRGLDPRELLRLVEESRSIIAFDRGKLSPDGRLTGAGDPEGARVRNDMHNRVVSDVFVPAGGRPEAINGSNWTRFEHANGRPASQLIVEGANLFLTQEARRKLFEAGVVVIKDSSANKCGVICSSYEVLACLLLTEAELLAIKGTFVEQVIDRLRLAARLEAELLFEVHRHHPATPHFEISILISLEINRLATALAARFPRLEQEHPSLVREAVLAYLPPVLAETAGERVWTQLPPSYRAQLVCTSIAASLVYREGLDYFRDVPESRLADLALSYELRDQTNRELVLEVQRSGLASAPEIARLLQIGGTRAALK
jgi:glutamate dehydrogenase